MGGGDKGSHRANSAEIIQSWAEEEGIGKGHFLERCGFEGCCVRKLRSFYIQKEAIVKGEKIIREQAGDTGPE